MEKTNAYKFGGEAVVDYILIQAANTDKSTDITALVEQFNIHEDIMAPFISADITLVDGISLLTSLPILGQERITIGFRSSFEEKLQVVELLVYKVSTIQEEKSEVSQVYTLYAASPEFVQNKKIRISESFSSTHDKMVSDIYKNSLTTKYKDTFPQGKPITIMSECNDFETLIVPSWNPIRAINWISSRARSKQNIRDCSYIFFERLGEGFFFGTLSNLCEADTKFVYKRTQPNFATVDGNRDTIEPIITIDQYAVDNDHNTIQSMTEGRYRSSLNYYDPVTREYSTRIHSSLQEFEANVHVEKEYPNTAFYEDAFNSPISNLGYYPIVSDRITGEDDYTPDVYLRRNSQISLFKSHSTKISVVGNSGLRAGDVVELIVPTKKAPRDGQKSNDQFVSGRFLIRSIKHNIIRNQEYKSFMILVRDSIPVRYPEISYLNSEEDNSTESSSVFDV